MKVLSDSPQNDLCVMVDHGSSSNSISGNTMYFNNELVGIDPSPQPSKRIYEIIDFQDFELCNYGISIKEGSLFRGKSVLKKVYIS